MSSGDIILQEGVCDSNIGKIKYVILVPIPEEEKQIEPITEDAEFEIIQPKQISFPQDDK